MTTSYEGGMYLLQIPARISPKLPEVAVLGGLLSIHYRLYHAVQAESKFY